ncbi:cytochrome c biogenesis protein ResB [Pararobbsia silviterrae]|uniref:Cytochrome c biogenesis protein ResB n=1 Tax=Pararobbsia silviterrae TaxID=1792498 RepID=A0A494X7V8_9BURK|nr:cytochrome c biogenesis protein ResB [Pararobbsia silviterrae]RKP45701.1 cytochrome c biogenesis protein ResB [Pararobbsia silviterrae]
MSVTTSGFEIRTRHRIGRSAVELLSSMRFAISLLVVLAIASIVGTVLTQDDPYPNYVNQFGPFWADIFRALGLYTVYSAWWFMLIMIFLVVSISLCVIRNGPKMIADMRSWKDKVREGSLRAFHHKAEFTTAAPRVEVATHLVALASEQGYRFKIKDADGATLIAAKRGAFTKIGYISAHLAIVVICIGGLLDSNLPIRFEMWVGGKSPIRGNSVINDIGPEHRLSPSNVTFRGNAWVPEGQNVSTAILNQPDGSMIQDLPFSIQLNKFIVDYYSTGMPKLFASDIVVIDHATGEQIPARVEVNKPFTYDGVSIYQSSFEDGGSKLHVSAWPMAGGASSPLALDGIIGSNTPLPGPDGDTIEFTDFRAINVENINNASGKTDVRGVAHESLEQELDARLGSGAKSSKSIDLHNVGPSIQYKIRDRNGQAREFNNYMVPLTIDGERVILAGVRGSEADPFRYLRIPADEGGTVKEWMLLRAALADPALRAAAAQSFAARAADPSNPSLREHLEESASRVLNLFAGAAPVNGADGKPIAGAEGGFSAVAAFIDHSVPRAEQSKAADLLLRMLEGSFYDLWRIARQNAGEPAPASGDDSSRFIRSSINALSDSFFYGAPVFLQLDSFQQIQASVFQVSRAPGTKIVYLGSLFLVVGVFAMFFVRERRVWFWVKETDAGTGVLMAMSTARRTLDFEKEFADLREVVGTELGAARASHDEPPSTK